VKIIRKRLYEQEGLPYNVRWDETCECVQSLFGDTWVDNPAADPRYNPGNLAPPNSETDPRCSAAFGMRTKIENIMDAFFLAQSLIEAANAIFALITVTLPGVGLIWRVIFAVVEALIAIGSAALIASFTDEAYDELQCIFYNNIDEDGQMSQQQFEDTNTQICEDMDFTICAAMGLMMNMLGFVGMSNAGAMFGEEGDCSECPVYWCYTFDFTLSDGEWAQDPLQVPGCGEYSPGVGWISTFNPSNNVKGVYINRTFDPSTLTNIEMMWEFTNPVSTANGWTALTPGAYTNRFSVSGSDGAAAWEGNLLLIPEVAVSVGNTVDGSAAGTATITRITLRGEGVNPFGVDNCEE